MLELHAFVGGGVRVVCLSFLWFGYNRHKTPTDSAKFPTYVWHMWTTCFRQSLEENKDMHRSIEKAIAMHRLKVKVKNPAVWSIFAAP